jgi:hypothetical protein
MNQWLIVISSALFGFWGCWKVVVYKVDIIETNQRVLSSDIQLEKDKVWDRFEVDKDERRNNRENISKIETLLESRVKADNEMKANIQKILDKLP